MGQELAGAPLALADDRRRADGGRDRERHDDGDRSEAGTPRARTRCVPSRTCRGSASCAFWGSTSSAWLTCCTARMSPTLVIVEQQRRRDERRRRCCRGCTIGTQKSARLDQLLAGRCARSSSRRHQFMSRRRSSHARRWCGHAGARSADGEVEVFERRRERLDAREAHAGRDERLDEIGHAGQVRRGGTTRRSVAVELVRRRTPSCPASDRAASGPRRRQRTTVSGQ